MTAASRRRPTRRKVGWIGGHAFAHRGLHGPGVPENSPAAFAAAIARGLGIECDVQRSGDGKAMVFHDWELDRLTGERGPVAARSSEELGRIRLAGSDESIPRLRQMLDQVAGQVPLLIEVKSRRDVRIAALCLAVGECWRAIAGSHAVMSFDPRVSRWFSVHSPHTVRGLVVTEENDQALAGRIRRHLCVVACTARFPRLRHPRPAQPLRRRPAPRGACR